LTALLQLLRKLPDLEAGFPAAWPEAAREVLPSAPPNTKAAAVWVPLIAATVVRWMLPQLTGISDKKSDTAIDLFEKLHLRKPLANAFQGFQIEGENSWRAASRVRLLVKQDEVKQSEAAATQPVLAFLLSQLEEDAEVRWLAGVHDAAGKTYFVKEPFDQLLWWLQVPKLLAEASAGSKVLADISREVKLGSTAALDAGFDYRQLILNAKPRVPVAPSALNRKTAVKKKVEIRNAEGSTKKVVAKKDAALNGTQPKTLVATPPITPSQEPPVQKKAVPVKAGIAKKTSTKKAAPVRSKEPKK
jgi:hypothetical protein